MGGWGVVVVPRSEMINSCQDQTGAQGWELNRPTTDLGHTVWVTLILAHSSHERRSSALSARVTRRSVGA